jgi:hypothetical protein
MARLQRGRLWPLHVLQLICKRVDAGMTRRGRGEGLVENKNRMNNQEKGEENAKKKKRPV